MRPVFRAYVDPARARPEIWRLLAGIVVMMAVYVGWSVALLIAVAALASRGDPMIWLQGVAAGETALGMLILFATFGGMALAPIAAARWLHGRGAATLFGRRAAVLHDFGVAMLVVFAIYAVSLLVWSLLYDATPNLDPALWLMLLPLSIAGLLVQTGAEELVFRGYLTQQLAARFRSPLIWMVLPSLLFGAVHFDPVTMGGNAWIIIVSATVFGLIATDLVTVTGNIGAAWGLHFANNFVAILVLATKGTLPGLALYVTPYSADAVGELGWLMLGDVATMALVWFVCRRLLTR